MSKISTNTEVTTTKFQHLVTAGLLNFSLERKYVADFSPTPPPFSRQQRSPSTVRWTRLLSTGG